MESRIVDILNRMIEEKDKFKELKRQYLSCKIGRNAEYIKISAEVYPKVYDGATEDMYLKLNGDVAQKIMDVIEAHFIQLGNQCKKNLEDMVEEMKQE